ncbi:hypothetical protein F5Y18DRAFT_395564 [Xylariaceae sp. FL1019]|nr:hypothetical protein F5Y18DRAFT_395564 [Xylariaceae sp. FL1019]
MVRSAAVVPVLMLVLHVSNEGTHIGCRVVCANIATDLASRFVSLISIFVVLLLHATVLLVVIRVFLEVMALDILLAVGDYCIASFASVFIIQMALEGPASISSLHKDTNSSRIINAVMENLATLLLLLDCRHGKVGGRVGGRGDQVGRYARL